MLRFKVNKLSSFARAKPEIVTVRADIFRYSGIVISGVFMR